jgi:hypothetical protein
VSVDDIGNTIAQSAIREAAIRTFSTLGEKLFPKPPDPIELILLMPTFFPIRNSWEDACAKFCAEFLQDGTFARDINERDIKGWSFRDLCARVFRYYYANLIREACQLLNAVGVLEDPAFTESQLFREMVSSRYKGAGRRASVSVVSIGLLTGWLHCPLWAYDNSDRAIF